MVMVMTDKQMMNLFLFGGRCMYHGQYFNVVGHDEDTNTYTLQLQNASEWLSGMLASECTEPPEVNG